MRQYRKVRVEKLVQLYYSIENPESYFKVSDFNPDGNG